MHGRPKRLIGSYAGPWRLTVCDQRIFFSDDLDLLTTFIIIFSIRSDQGEISSIRFDQCISEVDRSTSLLNALLKPYKGFLHNTKDVLRIAKDFEHT